MSGVGAVLRERRRQNARPPLGHRSRQSQAEVLRAAALSALTAPYCNDEMREHANVLLEMVGDTLTLPRHGWYPQAPKGWRP